MKQKNKLIVFLLLGLFILPGQIQAQEEDSVSLGLKLDEAISLDLKNIEIVELLRILSLKTGKTIVPTQNITGRITLFLKEVSFKDLLDIILLTQNYAVQKKGNIYYIMTNVEYKVMFGKDYLEPRKIKTLKLTYAKPANVFNALSQLKSDIGSVIADEASGTIILMDIPEKLEIMLEAVKDLDVPLQTEIFDLNYAKSEDAKTQLSAAITEGTGKVIVDERSSKAIVSDLPGKMEKIRDIVKAIDKETKQVFIEADIVQVTLSDTHERGIDWEKLYSHRLLDSLTFKGYFPQGLTSAYQQISVGTLGRDYYTVTLQFLETFGDVKILSQPRLAVVDNQEAYVLIGTRTAIVTTTTSTSGDNTIYADSVEFLDIGVKLTVTPKINEEGFITMKIKPEISSIASTISTSAGSTIPVVDTSEADTTVKVKDGTMIMIGGLKKETHSDSITGVPYLSRIPIIGGLFGKRDKEKEIKELIVFLTPHLTRGDVVLPGTEPEKKIPEDIMPQDLEKKLLKDREMGRAITHLVVSPPPKEEKPKAKAQALKKEKAKKPFWLQVLSVEEPKKVEQVEKAEEVKKPEPAKEIKTEVKTKPLAALEMEKTMLVAGAEEAKKAEAAKKAEQAEKAKQVIDLGVIKLEEDEKIEQQIEAELRKLEEREEEESIEEFTYAGIDPEFLERVMIQCRRALEYQYLQQWDEAVGCYEKVVELASSFVPAYNQLGIIYEIKGLTDKGEEMYLKAIEINPNYAPAYANLAMLSEERDDTQEAIKYWQKRIELGNPESVWTEKAQEHLERLQMFNKNEKQ